MATTSPNEHYGRYLQSWMDEQDEKNLDPNLCPLIRWVSAWIGEGYPITGYQTGGSVQQLCSRLQLLAQLYHYSLSSPDHSINLYLLTGALKKPLSALRDDLNFLHDFGLAIPDIDVDDAPTIRVTHEGTHLLKAASQAHLRILH